MSDIFKVLCQDATNERFFGVCDDKPNQRAYLDIKDRNKWLAVVQNKLMKDVTFTALDNCIEFRTVDGKMSSRCEGVLTYDDVIIFVEAKERSGDASTWAKDADKQLRASIDDLKKKVDLSFFTIKRAAIANRKQNKFNEKHSVRMKKFFNDTGFILSVNSRIVIE